MPIDGSRDEYINIDGLEGYEVYEAETISDEDAWHARSFFPYFFPTIKTRGAVTEGFPNFYNKPRDLHSNRPGK